MDNSITAKSLGSIAMEIQFVDGYITYAYKFTFNVKDEPEYRIDLTNVVDNKIEIDLLENSAFHIHFEILNRDEEYVKQDVFVVSHDESILAIESVDAPLIKIRGLTGGRTIITIVCSNDENVKVEIEVVVK